MPVSHKLIKRRNFATSNKVTGWESAVKAKIVSKTFATDFDSTKLKKNLVASDKTIAELGTHDTTHLLAIKQGRAAISTEERQVRLDLREKRKQASIDYHNDVKIARERRMVRLADLRVQSGLAEKGFRAKRAEVNQLGSKRKEIRFRLANLHEVIGIDEQILDGLIMAAFPGKKNEKLRVVVRTGDVEGIKRLASSGKV